MAYGLSEILWSHLNDNADIKKTWVYEVIISEKVAHSNACV